MAMAAVGTLRCLDAALWVSQPAAGARGQAMAAPVNGRAMTTRTTTTTTTTTSRCTLTTMTMTTKRTMTMAGTGSAGAPQARCNQGRLVFVLVFGFSFGLLVFPNRGSILRVHRRRQMLAGQRNARAARTRRMHVRCATASTRRAPWLTVPCVGHPTTCAVSSRP
jgi:hypothetical protein